MPPETPRESMDLSRVHVVKKKNPEGSKDSYSPIEFRPWLLEHKRKWGAIFAAIGIVVSGLAALEKFVGPIIPLSGKGKLWMHIIQVIFILACLLYLAFKKRIRFLHPESETDGIANNALDQFWRAWRLLQGFWLLLYIGLTIMTAAEDPAQSAISTTTAIPTTTAISLAGIHALNNLTVVPLILCYIILARTTVEPKENVISDLKTDKFLRRHAEEFLASVWLALTVAEMMTVALSGEEMRRIPLGWFGLLSGCIGALSIALLVGRLDSMLLGIPTWIIAALFLYCAIQPTFDEFVVRQPQQAGSGQELKDLRERIAIIILLYALIGKMLFFAVIEWLDSSGRLIFYVIHARQQYQNTPGDRDKFVTDRYDDLGR